MQSTWLAAPLIPANVLDFLCIHPFLDGNGRMARLHSLLLLYQAGYQVCRFISIERGHFYFALTYSKLLLTGG